MAAAAAAPTRARVVAAPPTPSSMLLYHGTTRNRARSIVAGGFRVSTDGNLGPGVYLCRTLNKAANFARDAHRRVGDGDGAVVLAVELRVERLRVNYTRVRTAEWDRTAFDACRVDNAAYDMVSRRSEWCVADPARVRVVAYGDLEAVEREERGGIVCFVFKKVHDGSVLDDVPYKAKHGVHDEEHIAGALTVESSDLDVAVHRYWCTEGCSWCMDPRLAARVLSPAVGGTDEYMRRLVPPPAPMTL